MTTVSLREAIDMGMKHHLAGRLDEAAAIYEQIMQAHPQQPEAIHLLGVIALQKGQYGMAVELINRAIDLQPRDARFHCNIGQAYAGLGLIEDAINAHRRALNISPDLPEALNNLGNALQQIGRFDEAIEKYQRALRTRPDFLEVHNNLGNALKGAGRVAEAIEAYRKALSIKGDYADAWSNLATSLFESDQLNPAVEAIQNAVSLNPDSAEYQNNYASILRKKGDLAGAIAAGQRAVQINDKYMQAHCTLGAVLLDAGQIDASIESIQKAIDIYPQFAEAYSNLGNALRAKGETDRAVEAYKKSIELKPLYCEAHANLGKLLHTLDRYEEAVESCRRALELKPGFPDALSDLGTSLINLGKLAEGVECYRQAVAAAPETAIIHYNLGLTQLMTGDYRSGWAECEWRWFAPELDIPYPTFSTPRWEGTALNGRHALIFAEQGFGDTLQYSRFATVAAKQGGPVTLVCQPELVRLMRSLEGVTNVHSITEPLPKHDVHFALQSLPGMFDTVVETIPLSQGYLKPDAQQMLHWRDRLASEQRRLKVGIAWTGRKHPDPKRSIPTKALAPLGRVEGVRFYSLQKVDMSSPHPKPPPIEMVDFMGEMHDFADTAALMANLDLVITIDTSIAHLAGAIGKKVWILLPFLPDWRWMLERDDSPWYASARLFRQPSRGDWQTPVNELVDALRSA